MELIYIRIICIIVTFIVSEICFIIPIFTKKLLKKRKSIFEIFKSSLNCLSCGIFFGILTLDLWPAALGNLTEEMHSRNIDIHFPIPALCVGIGFFIVFILEEFQDNILFLVQSLAQWFTNMLKKSDNKNLNGNNCNNSTTIASEIIQSSDSMKTERGVSFTNSKNTNFTSSVLLSNTNSVKNIEKKVERDNQHQHERKNIFIVVLSLSAHSLFDGIILGMKATEKDMWSFLLAVLLHHSIMSFSVGCITTLKDEQDDKDYLSKGKSQNKIRMQIILATCWSVVIPMGITITLFQAHIDKLITSVLTNIATGSFLYITFLELLPESVNKEFPYKINLLVMLIGYVITCLLKLE